MGRPASGVVEQRAPDPLPVVQRGIVTAEQLQRLQQSKHDPSALFNALADIAFTKEYLIEPAGTHPHLSVKGEHSEQQQKFDAIAATVDRLRPNHHKNWTEVIDSHRSYLRKEEEKAKKARAQTQQAPPAAAASSSSSTPS